MIQWFGAHPNLLSFGAGSARTGVSFDCTPTTSPFGFAFSCQSSSTSPLDTTSFTIETSCATSQGIIGRKEK